MKQNITTGIAGIVLGAGAVIGAGQLNADIVTQSGARSYDVKKSIDVTETINLDRIQSDYDELNLKCEAQRVALKEKLVPLKEKGIEVPDFK